MSDKFIAKIIIKNLEAVKDAQGEAIETIIKRNAISLNPIVNSGRYYELQVDAFSEEKAREKINIISKDVLSNPIIESYEILECKFMESKEL